MSSIPAIARPSPAEAGLHPIDTRALLAAWSTTDMDIRHDSTSATSWVTMHPRPGRPLNFSPSMLDAFEQAFAAWEANACQWEGADGSRLPVHYAVLRSAHPGYFNVGGDLAFFNTCITRGDFEALRAYSLRCMDLTWRWASRLSEQATTISLVQGRALGGGFESALSSDYVIAEEQAEFGLPEILFGLFPCSGGMPLLARRVGLRQAQTMMSNGKIYKAAELLEAGVIDEVCAKGRGEQAVRRWISEHSKTRAARQALQRARRRMQPLDLHEMATVVDDWVEVARQLEPSHLRVLDTLTRMQRSEFGQ
jgi:DSF synthase